MVAPRKSLADQAYEKIKNNILNLTYAPGMTLTESMLTQELGMSRNPIRTALKMLQSEGLIVTDYYKSMRVKEISYQAVTEIYQIRELFEGAAFKLIFDSGRAEEFSVNIYFEMASYLLNSNIVNASCHIYPPLTRILFSVT